MIARARANKSARAKWAKIITTALAVPAALLALYQLLGQVRKPTDVQIVAATVGTIGRPTLRVTVRNTTGEPAVLTKAELVFESATVIDSTDHASTELHPTNYNWILTLDDVERRTSTLQLSRRLDKGEPDALAFVLGFEKRHAEFDGRGRLRLHYNDGRVAESASFALRIVNGPGEFPQFDFPENSAELTEAMRTEAPYALRQILGELARRRFTLASPDVRRYFSHADATVRTAAAEYFSHVRDPEAATGLATLVEATETAVRRAALKALVAQGDAAFGDVERLMDSKDPAVRDAVLSISHEFPADRSLPLVRDALDDRAVAKVVDGDEVPVSAAALRALVRMRATSEADRIIRKLADPNVSVQLAAIDAVVELNLRGAVPALRRMAASADQRIKEEASAALQALQ